MVTLTCSLSLLVASFFPSNSLLWRNRLLLLECHGNDGGILLLVHLRSTNRRRLAIKDSRRHTLRLIQSQTLGWNGGTFTPDASDPGHIGCGFTGRFVYVGLTRHVFLMSETSGNTSSAPQEEQDNSRGTNLHDGVNG